MKRHIQDWLKVGALTAPLRAFFLEQVYIKRDIFASDSLLEVLNWRIQAGMQCTTRPTISGGREGFRGLLWRCRQHGQTMFGATGICYKIARPT